MNQPVIFYSFTPEDLESKLEAIVRKVFSEKIATSKVGSDTDFLTKKEAQKYMGNLSTPTFDKLVEQGKIIPYCASPGRLVFLREQLYTYILANPSSKSTE